MEGNSSDDDYEGMLKPAFDVKISPDFDPNAVPKDGNEYLQQVIYERNKCQKIVTAPIPEEYTNSRNVILIKKEEPKEKSPLAPSKEWQLKKLADFEDFRKYIDSEMRDRPAFITFHEKQFLNNYTKELPAFSKFACLSQRTKLRIIELLTRIINSLEPGMNIDDILGLWIFSLLAALEIPLNGSDLFTLRELARACIRIRSNLSVDVDPVSISALNLCICIVGRHFGQFDLIDV